MSFIKYLQVFVLKGGGEDYDMMRKIPSHRVRFKGRFGRRIAHYSATLTLQNKR